MKTREKIEQYFSKNLHATVREIQKACNISSPSVVAHHLKMMNTTTININSGKPTERKIESLFKEIQKIEQKIDELKRLQLQKITFRDKLLRDKLLIRKIDNQQNL